jgi:hypothetical protein
MALELIDWEKKLGLNNSKDQSVTLGGKKPIAVILAEISAKVVV